MSRRKKWSLPNSCVRKRGRRIKQLRRWYQGPEGFERYIEPTGRKR